MEIAVDFTELRGNDPIEFSLIGVFFFLCSRFQQFRSRLICAIFLNMRKSRLTTKIFCPFR